MEEQTLTYVESMTEKPKETLRVPKVRTSVIIYVKDCAQEVHEVHAGLRKALEKADEEFEVIFVDDGSMDESWSTLRKIAEDDWRVRLVRLRTSFGESASFEAGLKQARGQRVVFFTTRVRINTAQILNVLSKLDEGYDLVMGWRHPRRDSALNQFISKMFNRLIKWISKLDLHDINSGVFAARKEILRDVPLYGNLNIFLPTLAVGKGYKVGDVKIEQLPGKFRQSKYVSEYIQRLLDIVTVVFLSNYSKKPLHFLGFLGLIFTLVGAGMNLYLFIYRVLQFGPIAGRPLLLLGALFLVIGIQMISIGLIGEMIIFTHAREMKEYTIEEILE